MPNSKSNSFDPFLRVSPKTIRTTAYAWLVENVRSHTGDACLIWPFATNRKGYGILSINHKPQLAHRVAFEFTHGRKPKGCVVQSCKDRLCIAPKHLVEQPHATPHGAQPKPFERYEWTLRQIAAHHSNECLIWPYATAGGMKYGILVTPDHGRVYVHRLSFFLVHDHWPEPETLHSCDNPRCFNPYHLSEGTNDENTADKVRKGRAGSPALKGSAHGRSKLTEDEVQLIRIRYASGERPIDLAAEFGVTSHTIWYITHRGWKHV